MRACAHAEVWTWGRGEYGRLGLGDRHGGSKLRPQKVGGALQGVRVVQAACGGSHTAALTEHGHIFTWGRASFGRLGTGTLTRDALSPVEAVLPGQPLCAVQCCCPALACLAVAALLISLLTVMNFLCSMIVWHDRLAMHQPLCLYA